MKRIYLMGSLAMALSLSLFSCTDENSDPSGDDFKPMESDGKYVGEAVGNFSKEEWYPGGELGTTDNVASGCYEDESPAVTAQGLLDDFTEEDLKAQYASTANYYKNVAKVANVSEYVNPNFWDASADNFASGAWYPGTENTGVFADGGNGKPMVKRFTYALTRATQQDGPGANAIWNITNVTRPDRPKLYTTNAWAAAMAEDKEVIEKIKNDPTSPFWASTDDEISKRVNGLLKPGTNQFSNEWHNFEPEMSADHFYEFMVWHRGLAATNGSGVERLHDCRARNEVEAIMWHAYSKNSHAYNSALKFYNLSKADRDAVVMFLRSI